MSARGAAVAMAADPKSRAADSRSWALPFGKFKGTALLDVPGGYLQFLAGQDWLRSPLKEAVACELQRRATQTGTRAPRSSSPAPRSSGAPASAVHARSGGRRGAGAAPHRGRAGAQRELLEPRHGTITVSDAVAIAALEIITRGVAAIRESELPEPEAFDAAAAWLRGLVEGSHRDAALAEDARWG